MLELKNLLVFGSARLNSGTSYDGAIGDLQGDINGTPSSLSPGLKAIQSPSSVMIPTAMIGASMSQTQLGAVDASSHADFIRKSCGSSVANDPLAVNLTSAGWPTIVGGESDAIVPLNSQFAGNIGHAAFPPGSEVHSPGTEGLGFAGPSELDDITVIGPEVLQLLNTPVDNQTVFVSLP